MNAATCTATELKRSIELLANHISKLPEKDRGFAESLVSNYQKKGLSDKQVYWVGVLLERATKPKAELEVVKVGSMTKVIEMFNNAKSKLKWPKITFSTPSGQPIQLSISGPKAKKPGTINVTDGEAYGVNKWFGRVTVEGEWERAPKATDEIQTTLEMLSADPHTFASAYGHKTGRCCFCNKKLGEGEDQRSVEVGYGPTCAKNFGLYQFWKDALK